MSSSLLRVAHNRCCRLPLRPTRFSCHHHSVPPQLSPFPLSVFLQSRDRSEDDHQARNANAEDEGSVDDGSVVARECELPNDAHGEVDSGLLNRQRSQVTASLVELRVHGQHGEIPLGLVQQSRVEQGADGADVDEHRPVGGVAGDGGQVGDAAVLRARLNGVERRGILARDDLDASAGRGGGKDVDREQEGGQEEERPHREDSSDRGLHLCCC